MSSILIVAKSLTRRNKPSICVNIKNPKGVGVIKKLCVHADVLLDSYRLVGM